MIQSDTMFHSLYSEQKLGIPYPVNGEFTVFCPKCQAKANLGSVPDGNLIIACPRCKWTERQPVNYQEFQKNLFTAFATPIGR